MIRRSFLATLMAPFMEIVPRVPEGDTCHTHEWTDHNKRYALIDQTGPSFSGSYMEYCKLCGIVRIPKESR